MAVVYFGLAALVVAAAVIYRLVIILARLNLADFDEWAAQLSSSDSGDGEASRERIRRQRRS